MTTTVPPVPAGPTRTPARPARSRRWVRAALPFAVLLAVVTVTLVAHLVERPDPTAASFLSPVSDAGDGAATLVDRLRRRGVVVERQGDTLTALESARTGSSATLFVTAPDLVNPAYLPLLGRPPQGTRLVLVAPGGAALAGTALPVTVTGTRWTAAAPAPGCADPVAVAAGPAAVQRVRYATGSGWLRCYAGGLVGAPGPDPAVTLVGAADPFRNDRLAERGNAALAVGLLARAPRVIWLDLHEREQLPVPGTDGTTQAPPADDEPAEGRPGGPGDPAGPDGADGGDAPDPAPEQDAADGLADSPLARAFPAQVWAAALLVALALLVVAAASARRLGAPVAEPLPVRVQATETVQGHGRLYRRARARGPSLDILRGVARRRIAEQLGLPPDTDPADLADRAAAYTGLPAHLVRDVLAGPSPETDDELVAAAVAVQDLTRRVTRRRPVPQATDEGEQQ